MKEVNNFYHDNKYQYEKDTKGFEEIFKDFE
jgi:hypothetical protein